MRSKLVKLPTLKKYTAKFQFWINDNFGKHLTFQYIQRSSNILNFLKNSVSRQTFSLVLGKHLNKKKIVKSAY